VFDALSPLAAAIKATALGLGLLVSVAGGFRLKTVWAAFILSLGLLLSSRAQAQAGARSCSLIFTSYRSLNPTAAQDAGTYKQINQRRAKDYAELLFPSAAAFETAVRSASTILDIGGGRGRAMWDIANARGVHAIVINTQDFAGTLPSPRKGRLSYEKGWAEEVLAEMPAASVDLAFDVYGAFTYSPRKDLLIEEIYRVLKPGARAFVLFDFGRTPASVGEMRLDEWLVKTYPAIFSRRSTIGSGREMSVIEILKPKRHWSSLFKRMSGMSDRANDEIDLRLETVEADVNPGVPVVVPRVRFQEK
jgi:SAM-dependent methyltransferase